jgi:hypothetical protein
MKQIVFANSIRFTEPGNWWRIEFPNNKTGATGMVQHRCFVVSSHGWELTGGQYKWAPAEKRWSGEEGVYCCNCKMKAHDDVLAHAKIMGIHVPRGLTGFADDFPQPMPIKMPMVPNPSDYPQPPWNPQITSPNWIYTEISSTDKTNGSITINPVDVTGGTVTPVDLNDPNDVNWR